MTHDYTLVIPTYNRPHLLGPLLRYLTHFSFAHPILILDSSQGEAYETNQRNVAKSGLNIEHRQFDTSIFFYDKLRMGLTDLNTPLFSFCADDDFIWPPTIQLLVQHLRDHADTTFSQGLFFRFTDQRPDALIFDDEYTAKSYPEAHPLLRAHKLLQNFEATFYSVFRREIFLEGLHLGRDINSLLFNELINAMAPILRGKGHGISAPQYFRSSEPPSSPLKKWHPAYWFVDDPISLRTEYEVYRTIIEQHFTDDLARDHGVSPETLRNTLDLCHGHYMAQSFRGLDHLVGQQVWNLLYDFQFDRDAYPRFQPAPRKPLLSLDFIPKRAYQSFRRSDTRFIIMGAMRDRLTKDQRRDVREAVTTYFQP